MTTPIEPKRGEIWIVDFNPTRGAEIQKQRPAVVISSDAIGRLPLRLAVPLTEWKPQFANNLWHVPIRPSAANGLTKESAADALQIRSADTSRFIRRLGRISEVELEDIITALAIVVEWA